jgi:hypothetical protein
MRLDLVPLQLLPVVEVELLLLLLVTVAMELVAELLLLLAVVLGRLLPSLFSR